MGLVANLLRPLKGTASASTADAIADIEARLARLSSERAQADSAFKGAHMRRAALLLTDASNEDILAIDAEVAAAALVLERLELIEPKLLEELAPLREKAKQERWKQIFAGRYSSALADYAAKFRAALEAFEALAAVRGEAQRIGLGAEAAHAMPVVGHILTREILGYVERELDRVREVASDRPRAPAPSKAPEAAQRPVAAKPIPVARPTVEITPSNDPALLHRKCDRELLRIVGEVPPGKKAVRLLRSQIDIGGRFGWKGDELALPEYTAQRLVENSCAELIESEPAREGARAKPEDAAARPRRKAAAPAVKPREGA